MAAPLAERMRPKSLDGYIGQEHILGVGKVLRKAIESGQIPSTILWGPPGVGKTTLAHIISQNLNRPFFKLSAVSSGVKDVRETIEKAKRLTFFDQPGPILFIDEIHRFNKSQQDSLLHAVENGIITLIGATTENPSFEVIPALMSRCQTFILEPLNAEQLLQLLDQAILTDFHLQSKKFQIKETGSLLKFAAGDARKLYNIIELLFTQSESDTIEITNQHVEDVLQNNLPMYDKGGEYHYDIISAFIKSIRGSDPNATVYWLARMIAGGEDPKFICRRMIISASEDIGMANPNALLLATACFEAVHKIGYPEGRIIMSQTAIYLACSSKSNSSYQAINKAMKTVTETGNLPVPLHLRNAPTQLMKDIGYGKEYEYSHEFENNISDQSYTPDELSETKFYEPSQNEAESRILRNLLKWWPKKYKSD